MQKRTPAKSPEENMSDIINNKTKFHHVPQNKITQTHEIYWPESLKREIQKSG